MAIWYWRWSEGVPATIRGSILSIGNFDGVHVGHRLLFSRLIQHARRFQVPATALTFDPHPMALLRPQQVEPLLTLPSERSRRILALGVDHVIVLRTDWSLLEMEAERFLEEVIVRQLRARGLVEGPTFTFGRERRGTTELLAHWCARRGLLADVVPPLVCDGEIVCSSRIRRALLAGEVAKARAWLGRPYCLTGRIGFGEGRGQSLGFPTANLEEVATLVPGDGVYAGSACWRGQRYPAAIHIGPNPTFGTPQRKLEVYLVGLQRQLYGERLTVQFLQRLRDVRRFDSTQALRDQIACDIEQVQAIFNAELAQT